MYSLHKQNETRTKLITTEAEDKLVLSKQAVILFSQLEILDWSILILHDTMSLVTLEHFESTWPFSKGEPLPKRKAQYRWPHCTNQFRSVAFYWNCSLPFIQNKHNNINSTGCTMILSLSFQLDFPGLIVAGVNCPKTRNKIVIVSNCHFTNAECQCQH